MADSKSRQSGTMWGKPGNFIDFIFIFIELKEKLP